jgi:hypothetical protein
MALTDDQMANIVFNETRSLSGEKIAEARKNVAHSIINAQAVVGTRPKTGPTVAHVPKQESDIYAACVTAVADAREDRKNKLDPTSGATNFNFRKNDWKGDFYGLPIKTQVGPLDNSYPTTDLPASNIYANTYGK